MPSLDTASGVTGQNAAFCCSRNAAKFFGWPYRRTSRFSAFKVRPDTDAASCPSRWRPTESGWLTQVPWSFLRYWSARLSTNGLCIAIFICNASRLRQTENHCLRDIRRYRRSQEPTDDFSIDVEHHAPARAEWSSVTTK